VIPVAIAGANGRVGRMLIAAMQSDPALRLCGALGRTGSAALGSDASAFLGQASGITITDDLEDALGGAQVLIDFTRPEATRLHLAACEARGIAMVIGTTGLTPADHEQIAKASQKIAIVFSPNMSVGVNVVFRLLEVAARALDGEFDVEITEAHHRHKVDAPSGTALRMGEVVAAARGTSLKEVAVFSRHDLDAPRQKGSIGFASVRAGDIVGDHTVLFAAEGERVEITHRSSSRATYAAGSLRAVHFLAEHPLGLYDMQDVLGIRS
jgi:4-hydroxy-tetrahydrodipicolinate reductase